MECQAPHTPTSGATAATCPIMPETRNAHDLPAAFKDAEVSLRRFFTFAMVASEKRDQLAHSLASAATCVDSRVDLLQIRVRTVGARAVQRVDAELETRTVGEIAMTASWAVMSAYMIAFWGLRMVDEHSIVEVIVRMGDLAELAHTISQELAAKFSNAYIMCPLVIKQQSSNGSITPLLVFRPVLVALKSVFGVGNGITISAHELQPVVLQGLLQCQAGWEGIRIGDYIINAPLVPTTDSSTWCINMMTLQCPLVGRVSKQQARHGVDAFRGWEPVLGRFNKALFAQSLLCYLGADYQALGRSFIVHVSDAKKMEHVYARILGLIKSKGHRQCPILFPTADGDNLRMFPLSHVASAAMSGRDLTADHLKQTLQPVFLSFRRNLPIQYGDRVVNSPILAVAGMDGKETGDWTVRSECFQLPTVRADV